MTFQTGGERLRKRLDAVRQGGQARFRALRRRVASRGRALSGALRSKIEPPATSRAGRVARRLRRRVTSAPRLEKASEPPQRPIAFPSREPVTVIVPIYNAYADLERCLEALVRNTPAPARLLLVDDASTDERVEGLLERYSSYSNVEVLRNPENLGFTGTVNRALEDATGDVVILNSDTEVTPRWLPRLAVAAASDERIATVTAVSNNAGAFSVPQRGVDNALPEGVDKDGVGRLVARTSLRMRPETPTANGFCMYVKRAVLDEVGGFDVGSFPRGYGEENDFSMRARERGWRHIVDDATFVHHRREASFGPTKGDHYAAAQRRLRELHPDYSRLAKSFVRSPEMRRVRARTGEAFRLGAGVPQLPRLLYVLQAGGGGAPFTNRDLMGALRDRFDCLLLTSDGERLRLERQIEDELEVLETWRLASPWKPMHFSRPDHSAIAGEVLADHDVELVHVRHLFRHTFDLPRVASALGVPLIFSFHDFYACCPTIHLLDDRHNFCGGTCTPGDGVCRIGSWAPPDLPHLKHQWVHTWKGEVSRVLEKAHAVVTTTPSARDVHLHALPVLRSKRFEVIEHGRDLEQGHGIASRPRPGEPVRLLVLGNVGVHKGGDFIRKLIEEDTEGRLELHFLGHVHRAYRGLGVEHGRYRRDEVVERIGEIGPSLIGIFSIWAETYTHTLTEAWAAGVPVVATDIGAPADRIAAHGGGWTVALEPAAAYRRILEIADDPEGWDREARWATLAGIPSVKDMAARYAELYGEVLDEARAFRPPPPAGEEASRSLERARAEAAAAGRLPAA